MVSGPRVSPALPDAIRTRADLDALLASATNYEERAPARAARVRPRRMRALLASVGDPQRGPRVVHVAGSKGKGSVCRMADAVLREEARGPVGLYTSPHLEDLAERVAVDGAPVADEELRRPPTGCCRTCARRSGTDDRADVLRGPDRDGVARVPRARLRGRRAGGGPGTACAPPPRYASPSSPSRPFRSLRVSVWNVPSTWSNWTGPAVWLIGIVSPSPSSGADGEPGCRSTKKLPSSRMRGRIFSVASLWIGRALSVSSHRHARGRLAVADRLDLRDLADVDAGDPHERARLELVGVRDDRVDLVLARGTGSPS